MASPSGSSGSNCGSEGHLQQHIMEQRKRKRKRKRKRILSNRESARRSRRKKRQYLDDLIGQLGQLKKENNQIITSMGITTQLYLNIEAEDTILRTQMAELSNRLQSLNEIIDYINSTNYLFDEVEDKQIIDFGFMNPWNYPIMASADMLMY